jgi:hypothetical protein
MAMLAGVADPALIVDVLVCLISRARRCSERRPDLERPIPARHLPLPIRPAPTWRPDRLRLKFRREFCCRRQRPDEKIACCHAGRTLISERALVDRERLPVQRVQRVPNKVIIVHNSQRPPQRIHARASFRCDLRDQEPRKIRLSLCHCPHGSILHTMRRWIPKKVDGNQTAILKRYRDLTGLSAESIAMVPRFFDAVVTGFDGYGRLTNVLVEFKRPDARAARADQERQRAIQDAWIGPKLCNVRTLADLVTGIATMRAPMPEVPDPDTFAWAFRRQRGPAPASAAQLAAWRAAIDTAIAESSTPAPDAPGHPRLSDAAPASRPRRPGRPRLR